MTNKELIEKLVEYFLTQDSKVVARILANQMIDMRRLILLDRLPKEEAASVIKRSLLNMKELERFSRQGPKGDITVGSLNNEF